MDQSKVTAVKELQWFLGFANSILLEDFVLLPAQEELQAYQVLQCLKTAFSIDPILKYADPAKPFFMDVAASYTGLSAVLSSIFWKKKKKQLHPMAFFFKKLMPAE